MRKVEALSIRISDIDFDSRPSKIILKGKYTKTKTSRIVFLTEEIASILKALLDYIYRTRIVCYEYKKEEKGKTITEYRTSQMKGDDRIFSIYQSSGSPHL